MILRMSKVPNGKDLYLTLLDFIKSDEDKPALLEVVNDVGFICKDDKKQIKFWEKVLDDHETGKSDADVSSIVYNPAAIDE